MASLYRRQLSDKGARFIARFEGFVARPYNDPAPPHGNCTIGYGHLIHLGPCVAEDYAKWGTLDLGGALELLQQDAAHVAAGIASELHILRQARFDAMVSLAFNIGLVAFLGSSVVRFQRGRLYKDAADAFLLWDKADGQVLPGLVKRRQAERRLYLTGDYGL